MAENKWVTWFITLLIGIITPFITDRVPPCRLTWQWKRQPFGREFLLAIKQATPGPSCLIPIDNGTLCLTGIKRSTNL